MTPADAEYLSKFIEIGRIKLRNRFVRSATHEWHANDDGSPSERIGQIYDDLARHQTALIISGYAYISPDGKGSERQQGIHGDHVIPSYKGIADRIHGHGSHFFIQLVHNGRHSFPTKQNPRPIAPSELPIPGSDILSREMTREDMDLVIKNYDLAISRALRSNADGVQLHCAHGFLLSSFFSPFLNRREDDWGGDTERRTRIAIDILKSSKKKHPEFPVIVKMNSTDGVKGGIDKREAVRIAKILNDEGIDAIEVSGGIEDAPTDVTCQRVLSSDQEAYFKEYSKAIREHVDCPVILVGGLRSIEVMNTVLKNGYADMISLSRPLIREPDLVEKLLTGIKTEATCVSCNKCFDKKGIRCNRKAKENKGR